MQHHVSFAYVRFIDPERNSKIKKKKKMQAEN